MEFSATVRDKAITSFNGELAWKLQDVLIAISELTDNGYAILGGDVWALMRKESGQVPLTQISRSEIAVGIIKGQDGADYVFNWHSDKKSSESWEDYVKRTKKETLSSIKKLNAEQVVADEFKDSIYYNLVYVDQKEFENLR
jgi:hypothetical protein